MHDTQQTRRKILLAALGTPLLLRAGGVFSATGCQTAATSLLGAAYKPGAPARTTYLADPAEPGAPLRMTGLLTAADTCRRLRDASIEVWQADSAGRYDMDTAKLRGAFTPGNIGRYAFDTVVPGHAGEAARCIHFRVTSKGYETHVTRCFFAGDERQHADALVKPKLVVALGDAGDESRPGLLLGTFDIALTPEAPVTAAMAAGWAAFAGTYDLWLDQKLRVTVVDKQLHWAMTRAENPGEPVSGVLYPRSEGLFFCPEYDYTVAFVKDDQGKVIHALIRGSQIARKTA
jgi:protocatechuate 3,4-dioxygenase beta subunit